MVPSDMKNGGGASHHILGGSGYGNTMNYKSKVLHPSLPFFFFLSLVLLVVPSSLV
jgi:hypothetical protein